MLLHTMLWQRQAALAALQIVRSKSEAEQARTISDEALRSSQHPVRA